MRTGPGKKGDKEKKLGPGQAPGKQGRGRQVEGNDGASGKRAFVPGPQM